MHQLKTLKEKGGPSGSSFLVLCFLLAQKARSAQTKRFLKFHLGCHLQRGLQIELAKSRHQATRGKVNPLSSFKSRKGAIIPKEMDIV